MLLADAFSHRFPVRCVPCGVVTSCAQAFVRPLYLGTARNPESVPVVGGRTWRNFVRAVGEREYVAEAVCARTPALVVPSPTLALLRSCRGRVARPAPEVTNRGKLCWSQNLFVAAADCNSRTRDIRKRRPHLGREPNGEQK